MFDSGEPHRWLQVPADCDLNPGCCFRGPRFFLVLHQGALQDSGEGAEGANNGGAAPSSSEGFDDDGMMSWAYRRRK